MANLETPSDLLDKCDRPVSVDEGAEYSELSMEMWDLIFADDMFLDETDIANRFDMSQNTWDKVMDGEMTVDDTGRDMSGGGNLDG